MRRLRGGHVSGMREHRTSKSKITSGSGGFHMFFGALSANLAPLAREPASYCFASKRRLSLHIRAPAADVLQGTDSTLAESAQQNSGGCRCVSWWVRRNVGGDRIGRQRTTGVLVQVEY